MESQNHYAVLGISRDASLLEIKAAFRAIASECHPDRTASTEKQEQFVRAGIAYTVLYDPAARAVYDKKLGLETQCPRCGGARVIQKTRGFTQKFPVPCPACG